MLRLEILSRVPNNAANLAWVQAPAARADVLLSTLGYYHLIPENLSAVFGGVIVYDPTSGDIIETDDLIFSNRSVIHRDVRTPQPLWYVHRLGKDRVSGAARYEIVNSDAGAATLAEARLILLRALKITDQHGNVDRSINWDLEIISRSGDRSIIDIYVNRLNDQNISFFVQYTAFDTTTGLTLTNHREVINPIALSINPTIADSGSGFSVTDFGTDGRAPGLAVWATGTLSPPTVQVTATGILVAGTGISRGQSISDVASIINDLDANVFATPLSPNVSESLQTGSFAPSNSGTVIDQDVLHVKLNDATIIEVRPFRQADEREPWYAQIGVGKFRRTFGQLLYTYSIPEFNDQIFSTRFGAGTYREVAAEKPKFLGKFTLKVSRTPILKASSVKLIGGGDIDLSSLIDDVDLQNGIIYLNSPVSDTDQLEIDYAYAVDTFEYRGVNLNPTLQHNNEIANRFVGIYIIPSEIRTIAGLVLSQNDQTVFHIVTDSVQDIKDVINDPSLAFTEGAFVDTLYRPILLAVIQPVQTAGVSSVRILDTRTRGGGVKDSIKKDQFPTREGEMLWDIGFWGWRVLPTEPCEHRRFPRRFPWNWIAATSSRLPNSNGIPSAHRDSHTRGDSVQSQQDEFCWCADASQPEAGYRCPVANMNDLATGIDSLIEQLVDENAKKRASDPENVIVTESLPEVLEKLVILHVRLWNLEDRSRDTDDDSERGAIKRKIDYCNGVIRPRLLQAISSGLPTDFQDVKHYGDNHPVQ